MSIDRGRFVALFAEAVQEDPATVGPTTRLVDLEGWDSLSIVTLIAEVDEAYDVVLSPADLDRCETVGDVAGLVEAGRGASSDAA